MPKTSKIPLMFCLAGTIGIICCSPANAQIDWNNNTGIPSPWLDDDGNWTGGVRPGSGDTANFGYPGIYEVWWNANTVQRLPEVGSLSISDGDVTFLNRDAGPQFRLDILGPGGNSGTQGDFRITGSGTSLTIQGLHLHSLGGASITGGATFNIDGSHSAGSQFSQDGWSGFDVSGDLNVTAGGIVNSHQAYIGSASLSNGTALIRDAGSQWNTVADLYVGNSGHGVLNIDQGGVVTNRDGYIGQNANSTGGVVVDGSGSQWNSRWLRVGNGGAGQLWIHNGGSVTSTSGTIGRMVDGSGSVWLRDAGSQWINSAELIVGNSGDGTGAQFFDGQLFVDNEALVSSTMGYIGLNAGARGSAIVSDGAQWNMSSDFSVGQSGIGSLQIRNGGSVSSRNAYLGRFAGASGDVLMSTFSGSTPQWNVSQSLYVGHDGDGTLDIFDGIVTSRDGFIANTAGSTGDVSVGNQNIAQWNLTRDLFVGGSANSAGGAGNLNINTGDVTVGGATKLWSTGTLNMHGGTLTTNTFDNSDGGSFNFNDGTLTVTGPGGTFTPRASDSFDIDGSSSGDNSILVISNSATGHIPGSMNIGSNNGGFLFVTSGGTLSTLTFSNIGASGFARVYGTDSQWNINQILNVNGTNALVIQNGGRVSSLQGTIGNSSTLTSSAIVHGAGSEWNLSSTMSVGSNGIGELTIDAAGVVNSAGGRIGNTLGSVGTVEVRNAGSQWNNSNSLAVGYNGVGTLNVQSGVVSNTTGYVGQYSGSTGLAIVQGSGTVWNNSANLVVGHEGTGTLDVVNGGMATDVTGYIGRYAGSTGTANVSDPGSHWDNAVDLHIGGSLAGSGGTGILNIHYGGRVSVGNTTHLYSTGTVNLNGGRFEFGSMALDEFNMINAISGSLAGDLNHTGYTDISTLTTLQIPNVDMTEVNLSNSGTLYGHGSIGSGITNTVSGQLETVAGERMRFAGPSINAGEINNFGGVVRFDADLVNEAGGFISGRGQYIAEGGWINSGVMAFSGGPTEILGDVEVLSGGQIVTSGGATTTFYDDVIHNGDEIRTAAGSNTVFFGEVSGAGSYTGTGTVFYEGDLRPGNSPAVIDYEGNVVFGSGSASLFELGGLGLGEFDQLAIDGDLFLDGLLNVALIDGFRLSNNDSFLIVDVGGSLSGQFTNLNEGSLVGNFGGRNLFITYGAGDGNDVRLFTAVPEPGYFGCLIILVGAVALRRRRRQES